MDDHFPFLSFRLFCCCCCSFLLPSLSTFGPLEHVAPTTQPRGRGGCPFLRRAHQTLRCCPAAQASRSGDRWPSRKCCPWKNGTPQSGLLEIHARVQQVVLFQVDHKHRQEFRQSSFPFLRGRSPVPPQSTSGFPLPEKNPKTHGVLAKLS